MCLETKIGETAKIANEDILVYKWVKRHWNSWIPPIRKDSKYKYNTVLTALDVVGNPIEHLVLYPNHYFIHGEFYNSSYITVGFHCSTIKSDTTNVVCIIPKGAEYCYGNDNDVVSTKLIVFKHKWNYLWYKLWHR